MRRWLVGLALLAACSGTGTTGPSGPEGPEGPAGPGTRLVLLAGIDGAGTASEHLPPAAGNSYFDPPSLTCYTAPLASNVWLKVSDAWSSSTPYCGLVFQADHFVAQLNNGIPGWQAAFVVIY